MSSDSLHPPALELEDAQEPVAGGVGIAAEQEFVEQAGELRLVDLSIAVAVEARKDRRPQASDQKPFTFLRG